MIFLERIGFLIFSIGIESYRLHLIKLKTYFASRSGNGGLKKEPLLKIVCLVGASKIYLQ